MGRFNTVNARARLSILVFTVAGLLLTAVASCRKPGQEPHAESEQQLAHGPKRKCELCHGRQDEEQIASAEVKLAAKLPQLCLKCHPNADYSTSTEFVHGPLAVAECIFCHDPHLSKNEHLLRKPVPEMCYQCHEKDVIDAIPDHLAATACLSCHAGHSSPKKALLIGEAAKNS